MLNYYEILGVAPDADEAFIEARFRQLSQEVDFEVDHKQARVLQKALSTLLDAARRRAHDQALGLTKAKPALRLDAGAASEKKGDRLEEFQALVRLALDEDGILSSAKEQQLNREARRLGLTEDETACARKQAVSRPRSRGDLLKQKSCPRCEHRFNAYQELCPRCELEQVACLNRDCGAMNHAPASRSCGYCGASLSRRSGVSTFRGDDARSGEVRGVIARRAELAWVVSLERPMLSSPVAAQGYVYVGTTGGLLHAFTASGTKLHDALEGCSFPRVLSGGGIAATPVIEDGVLYVVTAGGSLYAIDAWSGADRLPELHLEDRVVASPLLHEGILYLATLKGRVLALRASDFSLLWEFVPEPGPGSGEFHASPVRLDDRLLVVDESGRVFALSLGEQGGALLWSTVTSGRVRGTPLARNQEICCYATDGRLTTLKSDGTILASQNAIAAYVEGSPASWRGGLLFIGAANDCLYAQDPMTGIVHGAYPVRNELCNTVDAILSSPVCLGDMVFYGGEAGFLYGLLAPEAKVIWSCRLGSPVRGTPSYDGRFLYVGDEGGSLHAFRLIPGED